MHENDFKIVTNYVLNHSKNTVSIPTEIEHPDIVSVKIGTAFFIDNSTIAKFTKNDPEISWRILKLNKIFTGYRADQWSMSKSFESLNKFKIQYLFVKLKEMKACGLNYFLKDSYEQLKTDFDYLIEKYPEEAI